MPKLRLFKLCFSLLFLAACGVEETTTLDQSVRPTPNSYPSWIPLGEDRLPANDLMFEGRMLTSEEALALKRRGTDLASLDPDANSDIWNPEGSFPADTFQFDASRPVTYRNAIDSSSGTFRFRADAQGGRESYEIVAAVDAHNILMRAELLRRLGYRVPKAYHVKELQVNFSNSRVRELFEDDVTSSTTKTFERWLKSRQSSSLVMQDLVVFSASVDYYNLSYGSIQSSTIRNRRLLRSLAIPYTLTEAGESINLFSWQAGRIINNYVALDLSNSSEFFADKDDAVWILRRLKALNRSDFEAIVKAGAYPAPVEKLLVEKIISRRNQLFKLFSEPASDISVNTSVSFGSDLRNGKLTKESWPGYAARYAFGDPENPLSGPEITAYFQSTLFSNLIKNLVSKVNRDLLQTDPSSRLFEQRVERVQRNFEEFLKTGVLKEEPIGLSVAPYLDGDIIFARDIVTGSYLGTDSVIQLADTIGFNIATGAQARVDGLATNVFAGGDATAYYRRTLTHLKPIKSVRAALKYPYKNAVVPIFTGELVSLLDSVTGSSFADLSDSEAQSQLTKTIDQLNQRLEVGESIILTDAVSGALGAYIGSNFYGSLNAIASVRGEKLIIGRVHIHKKDANTIQIYDGKGDVTSIKLTAGVNFQSLPLIQISVEKRNGKSKTLVHSINLDPNLRRNPKIIDNLNALKSTLNTGSTELIKKSAPPFVIEHSFSEALTKAQILFLRWAHFSGDSEITVSNPRGQKKHYLRRVIAERDGKNWQDFTFDVVNSLISEFTDTKISLGSASSGDPGDTVGGRSQLRQVVFEGELASASLNQLPRESFVELQYRSKGWSLGRDGLSDLIADINDKYGFDFFPDAAFSTTDRIRLYRADLKIYLYRRALDEMAKRPRAELVELFKNYYEDPEQVSCERAQGGQQAKKACRRIRSFFAARSAYNKASLDKKAKEFADAAVRMVNAAEALLSGPDFISLVGGEQNLYAFARLSGFRDGDEAGDETFTSSSLGRFGNTDIAGPIAKIIRDINLTQGEFYALWLRSRL